MLLIVLAIVTVALVPTASMVLELVTLLSMTRPPVEVASRMPELMIACAPVSIVSASPLLALTVPLLTRVRLALAIAPAPEIVLLMLVSVAGVPLLPKTGIGPAHPHVPPPVSVAPDPAMKTIAEPGV